MKFELEEAPTITKTGGGLALTVTPIQSKVFSDPHRFIVFAKGRRCGGTYGAVTYVMEQLVEGKSILWIDTIQANLTAYFEKYFAPLCGQIQNKYWSWNEQKKILKILNGTLSMKSAERPENIEGFAYNTIICNEAGIIFKDNSYLWYNTLYPMIMDHKANVYFVGTPKGKLCKDGTEHLYYTFYKKGLDQAANPDWMTYQVSSYENPLLDPKEIKQLEDDVPPLIRRQEIYAEFIDQGIDELFKAHWWQYTTLEPAAFTIRRRILSLDTAFKDKESSDYSAWTMWIQTNDKFICLDAGMEHLNFPDLIGKTTDLYKQWKPDCILIEDKASGQSLIQMFQRTTMPVVAYKIDRDKTSRAIAVTPLIEQGAVQLMTGAWNKLLVSQCSLFPNGQNDDLCFAGDTLIATPRGDKPISSLTVGDNVITPLGVRRIIKTFCHVGHVINKFGLTCTPNHPIFSNNTFIPIDSLTQASHCSILNSWTLIKWYLKTALYSRVKPTGNLVGKAFIITIAHTILPHRIKNVIELLKLYTESFGKNSTVTHQFLKDLKFITKTLTGIIITLTIYNCYLFQNIGRSIAVNLAQNFNRSILKILDLLPLNGTGPLKAERGIGNMLQENWKKETNKSAWNVGLNFFQITPIENSVAIIATSNGVIGIILKWLQECVPTAIRNLKQKIVAKILLLSVPALAEPSTSNLDVKVYNLEVEHAHCYYANKLLVGNCDSLSQALLYMSQGMGNFDKSIRPTIVKTLLHDTVQTESQQFEVFQPYGPRGQRERTLTGYWD